MRSLETGVVTAAPSLTVEVAQPLLLSCNIIATAINHSIHQVYWFDPRDKALLMYEQRNPVVIIRQDPGVHLTDSPSNGSYITIKKVRPDDEGCYRCAFDILPMGWQEAVTCVSVTG